MIQVIHGEIWSENFAGLNKLIKDFQSCMRFSYCRFNKDNMELNNVRKAAKTKYQMLNARHIYDAVNQGQALKTRHKDKKIVFGSRKAWEQLKSGKITKEEWLKQRDNQLYCRGEKNQDGNLNARIIGDTLRINLGIRKWITCKLFVPEKYKQELKTLLSSGQAYNVRLKRKADHYFKVMIDYQIEPPKQVINFNNGVIGVDTNPDRVAVSDVTADGNFVATETFINNRILYGSVEKRNHDIGCLVKKVIDCALDRGKGIVFEDLKFDKDKTGSKKWKRKQSNFAWKKFLTLLEAKCVENGIQYKKVNPAYTSIIGKYKYRWMYKLTIHESAAFVIGRRGLGFNEKLSFYKADTKKVKELVLRTLAGKYKNRKVHSWTMWKYLNDNIEAVLTGLQVSLADLKEFVGNIWYRGETLRSKVFLKELALGSSNNVA